MNRCRYQVLTLMGYFIREGVASLTITYRDLADTEAHEAGQNYGSDTSKILTHTYTYYVVKSDDPIPETTVLQLSRDGTPVSSEGYIIALNNGRTDFYITSNNSGNYPVTYSVSPGLTEEIPTPMLYTGKDPYSPDTTPVKGTSISNISSSSGRKVWLDMNNANTFKIGTTSVVRVRIGERSGDPVSDYNVAYIIWHSETGYRS